MTEAAEKGATEALYVMTFFIGVPDFCSFDDSQVVGARATYEMFEGWQFCPFGMCIAV